MSDPMQVKLLSGAHALAKLAEDVGTKMVPVPKPLVEPDASKPQNVDGAQQKRLTALLGVLKERIDLYRRPKVVAEAIADIGLLVEGAAKVSRAAVALEHLAAITEGLRVFEGTDLEATVRDKAMLGELRDLWRTRSQVSVLEAREHIGAALPAIDTFIAAQERKKHGQFPEVEARTSAIAIAGELRELFGRLVDGARVPDPAALVRARELFGELRKLARQIGEGDGEDLANVHDWIPRRLFNFAVSYPGEALSLDAKTVDIENDIGKLSEAVAGLIAFTGMNPDDDQALSLEYSLREMILNAIEHGNLKIEYADKTQWKDDGTYKTKLRERAQLEENRDKRVHLEMSRDERQVRFVIRDDGDGFDVSKIPDAGDAANLFKMHGRGIVSLHNTVDAFRHNSVGNEVTLTVKFPSASE